MTERLNGLELEENVETLFKVESPLTPAPSNFGYIGVLLRNKLDDTIQCHICGVWTKHLGVHSKKHSMNSREYREKFGLPIRFPLCSRSISRKISNFASSLDNLKKKEKYLKIGRKILKKMTASKRSKYVKKFTTTSAWDNQRGLCQEQIKARYLTILESSGETYLSQNQVYKIDSGLMNGIIRRFGSYNKFRKLIGHDFKETPNKRTEAELIAILRAFYIKHKRVPKSMDFKKGSPCSKTYLEKFGSWSRALNIAGYK